MPLKRKTSKQRDTRITPEAVEAYRAGDEMALHRALGLKPWEPSPIDAIGNCPWSEGSGGSLSWAKVKALRGELEAAIT